MSPKLTIAPTVPQHLQYMKLCPSHVPLNLCSSFPDSKEQFPDFPFKNGGVAGAIELKRPVGAHCHGAKALVREDSADKMLAKKKLYIASAVCLVFMIGEVIGKRPEANLSY